VNGLSFSLAAARVFVRLRSKRNNDNDCIERDNNNDDSDDNELDNNNNDLEFQCDRRAREQLPSGGV
jgi:hypothetical protein